MCGVSSAEITVRLQPRARANEIVGEREGVLIARVTAPPLQGRANEALRRLIAGRARVGLGRVEIVRGAARRSCSGLRPRTRTIFWRPTQTQNETQSYDRLSAG